MARMLKVKGYYVRGLVVMCLFVAILSSGCASTTMNSKSSLVPSSIEPAIVLIEDKYITDANNLKNITKEFNKLKEAISGYDKAKENPTEQIRIRNEMITSLLMVEDYNFEDFKKSLYNNDLLIKSGFDLVNIAINTATSIFGNALVKSYLAIGATGLTGVKNVIDTDYYAKQTITSLINTMETSMADVKTKIYNKMKCKKLSETVENSCETVYTSGSDDALNIKNFSFMEAINLLYEYHKKASLTNAIETLAMTSESTKNDSKKNATEAEKLQLK
ncbi:MAG: hypothetical protein HQK92_12775 [Nitrospirae bacterium]|nr:hypothetical protein [Nitrospirota bacterium]